MNTIEKSSLGFPQLLTLLFIWLKLTNQIDWYWIWVISPILISATIATIVSRRNKE